MKSQTEQPITNRKPSLKKGFRGGRKKGYRGGEQEKRVREAKIEEVKPTGRNNRLWSGNNDGGRTSDG